MYVICTDENLILITWALPLCQLIRTTIARNNDLWGDNGYRLWNSGGELSFVPDFTRFKFKYSLRGLKVIRGHISGISSVGVTSNWLKRICKMTAISMLAK